MVYNKPAYISASVPINPADFKITFVPKKNPNKRRKGRRPSTPRDPVTGRYVKRLRTTSEQRTPPTGHPSKKGRATHPKPAPSTSRCHSVGVSSLCCACKRGECRIRSCRSVSCCRCESTTTISTNSSVCFEDACQHLGNDACKSLLEHQCCSTSRRVNNEDDGKSKQSFSKVLDCLVGEDSIDGNNDTLALLCTNTVCLLPMALTFVVLCLMFFWMTETNRKWSDTYGAYYNYWD